MCVSKPVRATFVTTSWSVSIGASTLRHSERRIGCSPRHVLRHCDHSSISAELTLTSKKEVALPPINLCTSGHCAPRIANGYPCQYGPLLVIAERVGA